jgi:TupA-like ATPgrasp
MSAAPEKPSLARAIYTKAIAPLLPGSLALHLRFYSKHRYWPNFKRPRALMEKILWLMMHDRHPLRAVAADRCKVRQLVATQAPTCRMPAQLWVGVALTEAVWAQLPTRFVIKGNHGSQMSRIVNKAHDSLASVKAEAEAWLGLDYGAIHGEWVYDTADRLLVVEEKLEIDGAVPPDWKFICGNGRVLLVQLDIGRFVNHVRNLYDRDFQLFDGARIAFPPGPPDVPRPPQWDEAVRIAEQLAASFDLIRVDLYLIDGEVYFGELTNFPGAGWDALQPTRLDFELGRRIRLQALP